MNKIFAIPSRGKTPKSLLDLRFGKCEYFVIHQPATGESAFEKILSRIVSSGIKLVELLKKKGVITIITGEVTQMS